MRDILYPEDEAWRGGDDAVSRARSSLQRPLPKRFYKDVTVGEEEGGFAILLDGRRARTPARNLLALPTRAAAEVVAAEWAAQVDVIDPAEMHATRIANVGIDRVEAARAEVIDEMVRYAGTDLTCYRAEGPEGLAARESAAWDPVLAHARERHGARFILSQGIGHAAQPEASQEAVRAAFAAVASPVALAALHTLTTLSGSALIALMLLDRAIEPDAAFAAASVEEDWNTHLWGEDAEAAHRRVRRKAEFEAAAALLARIVSVE